MKPMAPKMTLSQRLMAAIRELAQVDVGSPEWEDGFEMGWRARDRGGDEQGRDARPSNPKAYAPYRPPGAEGTWAYHVIRKRWEWVPDAVVAGRPAGAGAGACRSCRSCGAPSAVVADGERCAWCNEELS